MNNVTLGNERFTYYETLGGGQGACPDADGPSAVHVTLSNTLTTPAEALEVAYLFLGLLLLGTQQALRNAF
jgi:N-methylhydantoinase B